MITAAAKTKAGLFKAHRVGTKLFFEIPRHELNRDMLLVTEIAKTTAGTGYGGQSLGEEVVRWERRDNRILLRSATTRSPRPIRPTRSPSAVENANYAPIVKAFNVESWGPDSSAVVDVTSLFRAPIPGRDVIGPAERGNVDARRSFLRQCCRVSREHRR